MEGGASLDSRVTASLIKNKRTTLERIEKYISPCYFTDVNLYGLLYPSKRNIEISHWKVPGNIGSWQEWKFPEIIKQEFKTANIGDRFGPSWSTHWFKLTFQVPDEWNKKRIHLRWKSQSEAMLWSPDGRPLQGLSSGTHHQMRTDYCLSPSWQTNTDVQLFFVEMAGSKMIGLGKNGMINPPNLEEYFTLEMAEICVLDSGVYSLMMDLEILHDLAKHHSEDQRGFRALYTGNQIVNDIISGNIQEAQSLSAGFFAQKSGDLSNTFALIGNCHIDSAWLWPYSETKRKCARSWASTLELMKAYPEMTFAASQAQQFDWVKEYYPDLYARIKEKVKQNKFIPVGGTWVEMDGLIPSGESFIRQFLYGQKFFYDEFGILCKEFWLPDTFGYSAQIPQICKHFDIDRFLTQKLSWSLVNKFPHHTFIWEGIDGSQVLAHFPPGDSYELNVNVDEILRTEKNFNDKGRQSICAFLYGYGDGGGGPTRDMLERASRLANLDGCPKLEHMTPDQMFTRMESDKRNLCKWVGELFLELHNGTYTSQAKTKQYNRRCESAARRAEFILCSASALKALPGSDVLSLRTECELAWKKVLLNQFHDVLPGSSIGLVYQDSDVLYKEALRSFSQIEDACFEALPKKKGSGSSACLVNSFGWKVEDVIFMQDDPSLFKNFKLQISKDGFFVAMEAQPLSFMERVITPPSVAVDRVGENTMVENQYLSALFSPYGEIINLVRKVKNGGGRDVFMKHNGSSSGKGNLVTLYDDIPLFWDAWDVMDYHLETRKVLNSSQNSANITPVEIEESGPLLVSLKWRMNISKSSSLSQIIELSATSKYLTFTNTIEWKESHKFLKVEFETGLLAREASYDTQFGHIKRSTHFNTSWDSAKYEVCGHKWADLSEYDVGLAVLNDSKYGWSTRDATLSLSLLRSPKAPDDQCDMGQHTFKYAAMPHTGSFQEAGVIEASYEFNTSVVLNKRCLLDQNQHWLEIEGRGVILESCKIAEGEDPSKIVLRLYEAYGRFIEARLRFPYGVKILKVEDCNGMESPRGGLLPLNSETGKYQVSPVTFSAFQIRTIKLTFDRSP